MLCRTEAIALRLWPLTNTSRLVVWLTQDHGKVSTQLKGALRPRSYLLGQVDLFYTCELIYHAREGRELHIAREISPLHERRALRRNWKATAAAGWMADSVARICPGDAPALGFYELLAAGLDDLAAGAAPIESRLLRFELDLLHQGGFAPRLDYCGACGELLPPEGEVLYDARSGELRCARCPPSAGGSRLSAAARRLLRAGLATDGAAGQPVSLAVRAELRALLGVWLAWHFEINLGARRLALQILDLKLTPGQAVR